jgi:hypothetical protein
VEVEGLGAIEDAGDRVDGVGGYGRAITSFVSIFEYVKE